MKIQITWRLWSMSVYKHFINKDICVVVCVTSHMVEAAVEIINTRKINHTFISFLLKYTLFFFFFKRGGAPGPPTGYTTVDTPQTHTALELC